MESILDVARLFLSYESMTHKKLEKLCYYAQAWHYTLTGKRLVCNEFQAWVHGPVCPELYLQFRKWGYMDIPQVEGPVNLANKRSQEIVELVYRTYGHLTGDQLEALATSESPWNRARKGYHIGQYCVEPIDMEDMKKECLSKKSRLP